MTHNSIYLKHFCQQRLIFPLEGQRKTTITILFDDDTKLNPYRIQVSGSHSPPNVKDIAFRIYNYTDAHLDIVPSTLDLMYVALGQATGDTKSIEERFHKFVLNCRNVYDLVFIDCHPAGSLFTKTSLRNSDHVLIPVMPQRYATRGIGLMMQFIAAKSIGESPPVPHILFNCTPRGHITNQEVEIRANASFAPFCMSNTLKKFKAFAEPEGGQGFVWVSGRPYSTEAFSNLLRVAQELMTRTGA